MPSKPVSNTDWTHWGMPDECPECGEDEQLYAYVTEWEGDRPVSATVHCDRYPCGHSWDWPAESYTERGE